MDIISLTIMPIIAAFIVTFIFSKIYKNKVKVDHGFAFNYFGLSYRRKMIRTLYTFPISIAALVLLFAASLLSFRYLLFLLLITVIGFVIQFLYNYTMWKQEQN
ncbi:MAG: ATPase [Solibacillus sp.]